MARLDKHDDLMVQWRDSRCLRPGQASDIATLIHAFMLAACLKQDSRLKKVCHDAAHLLLPPHVAQEIISLMEAGVQMPSASVISRLRGRIDVCWMLVFRDRLHDMLQTGGVLVYPATDASPQAGRDYQMVVLNIIRRSVLPELLSGVLDLEAR